MGHWEKLTDEQRAGEIRGFLSFDAGCRMAALAIMANDATDPNEWGALRVMAAIEKFALPPEKSAFEKKHGYPIQGYDYPIQRYDTPAQARVRSIVEPIEARRAALLKEEIDAIVKEMSKL